MVRAHHEELNGLLPVAEIQFADFILPAVNQIISEAAKMRYRSDGDFTCPIVIRAPWAGAAALVSECKANSFPASVDSIPTSAGKEDHVSMGPIAGRHARQTLDHVADILAIELLCATRALDLRIFNTGGNIGGMLAPLVTPMIAVHFGWAGGLYFGSLLVLIGMPLFARASAAAAAARAVSA